MATFFTNKPFVLHFQPKKSFHAAFVALYGTGQTQKELQITGFSTHFLSATCGDITLTDQTHLKTDVLVKQDANIILIYRMQT